MSKTILLRGAGLGAVLAFGIGAAAHAADTKPAAHPKKHHAVARDAETPTVAEVAALRAEVAALEQRLDAAAAAARQAQAAAAQAQTSAQAAQTAAQNESVAINQIPADVDTAVAKLPKPHVDGWNFNGVKFTPGGYIAAEASYRSRGLISDGATAPAYGNFPTPTAPLRPPTPGNEVNEA